MGRLAWLAVLAALATFCVVQNAGTSAGVGRYIIAQRAALNGRGPRVAIDDVMGPANRLAMREGMAWSGRVAVAGLIGMLVYRRVRLKPDTTTRVTPDTTRVTPDTTRVTPDASRSGCGRG